MTGLLRRIFSLLISSHLILSSYSSLRPQLMAQIEVTVAHRAIKSMNGRFQLIYITL